jgi:hypothetical protein
MEPTPPPADGGSKPAPGALPLLYRRIEPLSAARHGGLKLRGPNDYGFARSTGIIPITLGEFSIAARQYPIVFLPSRPGAPPLAAAALGTGPGENLFVGADGRWLQGFYVPAYLRRYPFITGDTEQADRKAVYLDVESARVSREEGDALYEDQELSKLGKAAIEFCRQYHGQVLATAAFNAAMAQAEILIRRPYPADARPKAQKQAAPVLTIDERKLAAVDDTTFLDWRAKGWLPMIYLHLFSLTHFAALAQLKKRLLAAAAEAMPVGTA